MAEFEGTQANRAFAEPVGLRMISKHKDIVDDILEEYRAYDPHDLLTNSETMHRWEEPPYFDYSL